MFEWDDANLRKLVPHGLTRDEVESAFLDTYASDGGMQVVDDEERYVLFAITITAKVVRVIFTFRGDNVRVVTAHQASAGQRRDYDRERLRRMQEE